MTNAERQRRFRERHRTSEQQLLAELRESIRVLRGFKRRLENPAEYDELSTELHALMEHVIHRVYRTLRG